MALSVRQQVEQGISKKSPFAGGSGGWRFAGIDGDTINIIQPSGARLRTTIENFERSFGYEPGSVFRAFGKKAPTKKFDEIFAKRNRGTMRFTDINDLKLDELKSQGWQVISPEEYKIRKANPLRKNFLPEELEGYDKFVQEQLQKQGFSGTFEPTRADDVNFDASEQARRENASFIELQYGNRDGATQILPAEAQGSDAAKFEGATDATFAENQQQQPATNQPPRPENPFFGIPASISKNMTSEEEARAYWAQGGTGALPAPTQSPQDLRGTVEQQAAKLGNTSMANDAYVNAVFKAYHGRDANQQELQRFTGKGVQDVFNAIKAGSPLERVNKAVDEQVGPNITPETLQQQDPINLPGVDTDQVSTGDATSAVAGATQYANTLQGIIDSLQTAPTETEQEASQLREQLGELIPELAQRSSDQLAKEQELGIPQLRQDLAEIQGQMLTKIAEYEALKTEQEGKPITMSSIIGRQAQIQKAKASEIQLLQARALGLQGQLESAQATADRAIDLKYDTLEAEAKVYESQLNMLIPILDKEQKQLATAQTEYLAQRRDELQDKKQTEKDITKLVLDAIQNGADNRLASAMQNANSVTEAAQIAGPLLNSGGWTYVPTPAQRDQLIQQGYEITQANGRTYARPPQASNTSIQTIGGRKVLVAYDDAGNVVNRTDLGSSTSGSGGGGGLDDVEKEQQAFINDAADLIVQLDQGKISWGAAFDNLRLKYPQASNDAINGALGGGIPYNQETGEFDTSQAFGRAIANEE